MEKLGRNFSWMCRIAASVLPLLLMAGGAAKAADIKVLAADGIKDVIQDLVPKFERATGHKVSVKFASGGATVKSPQDGEVGDVIIAPKSGIDSLVMINKVAAGNVTALATTGISVAVQKGASKPDISSPEALKSTLLAAKSITYLNPADGGASGVHFAKVLDRLGIANEMKAKTIFAPKTSAVGGLVASGDAELGVIQYQLLFLVPGIEIIGPLPGDLQNPTVFSAAVMGSVREEAASKALITFLRSPEAVAAIKAMGMEPIAP